MQLVLLVSSHFSPTKDETTWDAEISSLNPKAQGFRGFISSGETTPNLHDSNLVFFGIIHCPPRNLRMKSRCAESPGCRSWTRLDFEVLRYNASGIFHFIALDPWSTPNWNAWRMQLQRRRVKQYLGRWLIRRKERRTSVPWLEKVEEKAAGLTEWTSSCVFSPFIRRVYNSFTLYHFYGPGPEILHKKWLAACRGSYAKKHLQVVTNFCFTPPTILCDLLGMVKWPFQRLSDLQLGF